MIIQIIKQALGLGRQINKETFLKELKQISEEKKKTDYYDIVEAEIKNLDPYDHRPKVIYRSRNLIWEYEREKCDVVDWLGDMALNKENSIDYRTEAIEDLRHTDNPKAIDYLLECLRDEDTSLSGLALAILEDKLSITLILSIISANPNHDKDMEFSNIGIDTEVLLKNSKTREQIIKGLQAIEDARDSLIQSFGNGKPCVNIKTETGRLRKELFDSLVQEHGEQRTKFFLINIALDGYYKLANAHHQAFLTLKENNGLEDLITEIKRRFEDPLHGVKFVDKINNER